MSAAPFDALKLSRQLRERARFDQDQAEGLAEALAEAFHEQIATKADLQAAVKDLHGELTTATVPILIVSRCSSSFNSFCKSFTAFCTSVFVASCLKNIGQSLGTPAVAA